MSRAVVLFVLLVALLAGCGQVVVFGHVVGDHKAAEPSTAEPGTATPESQSPTSVPAQTTSGSAAPLSTPLPSRTAVIPHVIKAVNITVTAEAAAKVTGDASRFSADALLDAIKTELKSRKLLDEQDPHAVGTAEVVVDRLGTRPTTNAIVFGYKMLAGTLEGDVRVTGLQGGDSTGSRIVAESKLTVAANGDDKNPLGPLYKRFAVLTADRLAGVSSQSQDSTNIPRF
jgi:hypothetical protein